MCFLCKKEGHLAKVCPENTNNVDEENQKSLDNNSILRNSAKNDEIKDQMEVEEPVFLIRPTWKKRI